MSSSSEAMSPSAACPGVEELRAFVSGEASLGPMTRLIEHLYVQKCPRCTDLVLQLPDASASLFLSFRNGSQKEIVPPLPTADAPTQEGDTPSYHPTSPTDLKGLRLGRYLIKGFIGKGGFGAVYEAFDELLGRRVAIKIPFEGGLSAQEREEVASEARLHASLDHPHIVPIYDVGQSNGIPCFFVSKLIEGENLSVRLDRAPPTPREAARIVRQIALALEHMRDRGLVHRDVKPRNILLDQQGTAFLVDFGLATAPVVPSESTPKQVIAGTLPYMAPEQARGDLTQIDHRTDIYALGVVLYELLTGVRPFEGDPSSLRQRIQTDPVVPPRSRQPGIPRELEAICLKALSREPDNRYTRAAEFAEDLDAYLTGEPLRHALRSNRVNRTVRWVRRNRTLVGLALSLVVLFLLLLWMMRREVETSPLRWPTVLTTEPAGAELTFFLLDPETGEPLADRPVVGQDAKKVLLSPGHYLVVAVLPLQTVM
ncbi:MAG: serine/threonine-protein kinase [Gemmataceae bacterium]